MIMDTRKILASLVAGLFVVCAVAAAPPQGNAAGVEPFTIDTAHSLLDFTVRLAGFTRVRGTFDDYDGVIMYDPGNLPNSYVRVVIKTESIHTGIDFRDKDLRSPKFFDAEKFPTITFESATIEATGDGFLATGPLTIRDVTKEVAIPFEVVAPETPDAWGNRRIAFTGRVKLNRKDFGVVGPKFWNEMISDAVTIEMDVTAQIPNYERHRFNSREKPSIGEVVLKVSQEEGIAAARSRFTELREAEPDAYNFNPQELILVARRLAQAERYESAHEIIDLLLSAYPQLQESKRAMAVIHHETAKWYMKQGKSADARKHCEEALESNPDDLVATAMLRYLKKELR